MFNHNGLRSLRISGDISAQQADLLGIDNGLRLTTYAIVGRRGSGIIGINGAAARLINPGDKDIIIIYAQLPEDEAKSHRPKIVLLDDNNHLKNKQLLRA